MKLTSRGPAHCAWFFLFFMIMLLFEIFLNVLYMYKQYIVGFMMIEGIVLELDVERIQL